MKPGLALVRKTALVLPGVSEHDYHGPKFTVGRKGFLHYWAADKAWFFKLPRPHQELLFEVRPDVFRPFRSGAMLWSIVAVEKLGTPETRAFVLEAWTTVVPKKVSRPYLTAVQTATGGRSDPRSAPSSG